MPLILLLDLDDTLLGTNLETFLPAYYDLFARSLTELGTRDEILGAMRAGVEPMLVSRDPTRPLQHIFESVFYPRLGRDPDAARERLLLFYREVFPSLCSTTTVKPGARELVDWANAAGHRLALATDPLFPRVATVERLRWAGLEANQFEIISSFETFHFSKSHPAYFAELLGRLGWPDQPVLMAGNDRERDLAPAQELGLATFHVDGKTVGGNAASGDLRQLKEWLRTHEHEIGPPAISTPDAILSVLESTPAVLQGMTSGLTRAEWQAEPAPDEWALIELVCHLRDTEREVHAQQLRTLIESSEPFVARPDAAYWAKQRRYHDQDGPTAINDFALARLRTIESLRGVPAETWSKRARHAIFGPSDFREVIGFMAEHDRLHLQQAWRTLQTATGLAHRN